MSYETNCPKCGIRLEIIEDPGIGPGGKDKEYAYCPDCHAEVASEMTNGFLYVNRVVPKSGADIVAG